MRQGACGSRPDLPWLTDTENLTKAAVRDLARVCRACPVRVLCSADVVEHDITGGYWAGKDRALPAVDSAAPVRPLVPVQDPLPGLFGGDAA